MLKKKVPKVLMVASQEIIEEQSDGGKKVSFRNYELLKEIFGAFNVYICLFTNHISNRKADSHILRFMAYRNQCMRMMNILRGSLFTNRENEKKVADFIHKEKFDIVFIDRSLFGNLIFEIRKVSDSKIWVFAHNLERNYFGNKFKGIPLFSSLICGLVEKSERFTFRQADCIMALTERDADLITQVYGCNVKYIIPSSFRDQYDVHKLQDNADGKLSLLFIGTMFGPNYEGIKWFVENVMPKLDDIKLKIVGKNFETKKEELEKDNIEVIGTVTDLEPYYYSNAVIVLPVFYGDGQKVKTVEAFMYGKTIIATNESLEGYDICGIPGIFRCNTADEFIKVINDLKKNGISEEYRSCVREMFLEKYSFQSIVNKYRRILMAEYEEYS